MSSKKLFLIGRFLLASCLLSACAVTNRVVLTKPTETQPEMVVGLPNPASVHCQELGGRVDIRTDASGGQFGVCVFPEGSECDEWEFFRGDCNPSEQAKKQPGVPPVEASQGEPAPVNPKQQQTAIRPVVAWVGHIFSAQPGSQYDDYLSLMPAGSGEIGLTGINPEIEAQIVALRDGTGVEEFPAFWGSLTCDVPDYGGCQLLVSELRYGQYQAEPLLVEGWLGNVACSHFNSSPSGICGNAFVLAGDFPIWYGLWSADPAILAQIEDLRDSGQTIQVWGQLLVGVPDVNGNQIQVDQIVIQ